MTPRTRQHFPRMKQRGGRRRARATQRDRTRKWQAYYEMFRHLGRNRLDAALMARLCVDQQDYWKLPDDPSDLWAGDDLWTGDHA